MAEELHIAQGSKEERYALLYKQIAAVTESESDTIANMANVTAMIQATFGFWWTGFYRVVGQELVLGPFQGPLACSRIAYGRGVCGTAWKEQRTQLVPDVEQFPGHIACSSASKSEIVVPLFGTDGNVTASANINSHELIPILSPIVDKIISEVIIGSLENTPPEISSDISDFGILLSGGSAMLDGIVGYLRGAVGVRVSTTKTPAQDAARGLWRVIKGGRAYARFTR